MTDYFDHLLTFPDEAAALAALGRFRRPAGWMVPERWIAGVIAGVALVRADAVYDEAGELVTPADLVAGLTIALALPAADLALAAIGAPYLIADRAAAIRGEPFIIATSYSPAQIAGILRVEPTWAGSCYPFGATLG